MQSQSINNSQSDFNKTKKSLETKKTYMNSTNLANFKETLNVFNNFNSCSDSINNSDKKFGNKRNTINVKVREKQEYEFPNIKIMQKEISKKIYTKESGDIIMAVKQSNEILRKNSSSSIKQEFSTINPENNFSSVIKNPISKLLIFIKIIKK
jgi:hypothetical protein